MIWWRVGREGLYASLYRRLNFSQSSPWHKRYSPSKQHPTMEKNVSIPSDIISMIASFVPCHDDAMNLLSIDRCTSRALCAERSSRLRRMRFEHARKRVAPGVARKYASCMDERIVPTDGDVVVCYWIGSRHLCRVVFTPTDVFARTLRDVVELRPHEAPVPFGRPVFWYVFAKEGIDVEFSLETHATNTSTGHAGGNFSMPYGVYMQWPFPKGPAEV